MDASTVSSDHSGPPARLLTRRPGVRGLVYELRRLQERLCESSKKLEAGGVVTLEELDKEKQANCPICSVVLEGVLRCIPAWELTLGGHLYWSDIRWFRPTWYVQGSRKATHQRRLEFFTLQDRPLFEGAPVAAELSPDTERIVELRAWIGRCEKNHSTCNLGSSSPLPTRVIDVGLGPGSLTKLSKANGASSRYACLSHCWGGSIQCRTTSENLQQYIEDGIPWESLPQSFQDAITIARALRIQYLWIDSLCIVQDDDTDWRRESLNMANIFRCSYLTIAATKSVDSNGGCFSKIDPLYQAHELRFGDIRIYARNKLLHFESNQTVDSTGISDSGFPLLKRAWAYQERLLSPRMVHFSANELIWECMETSACQCRGLDISRSDECPKIDHGKSLALGGEELVKRWRAIVEEYSSLNLTFERDKLPALAGLARQMQELRPADRYLAGLWEWSICSDMLWSASPGPANRPKTWRAPTWSWASINGPVRYHSDNMSLRSLIQLKEAHCAPVESDPTGELRSAYLILTGQVVSAASEWLGHSLSVASSQFFFRDYHPDLKVRADHRAGHNMFDETFYCLRLARDEQSQLHTEYFLVLKRVHLAANEFERIGLAECFDEDTLLHLEAMYREMEMKII